MAGEGYSKGDLGLHVLQRHDTVESLVLVQFNVDKKGGGQGIKSCKVLFHTEL